MVRVNFEGSKLLESIDSALAEMNKPNITINPPFDKYYRVMTPEEYCNYQGIDITEYDEFLADDPCNEVAEDRGTVIGYAVAKDEYLEAFEDDAISLMSITDQGKLCYNVADRVFDADIGEINMTLERHGFEPEDELDEADSPSSGKKKRYVVSFFRSNPQLLGGGYYKAKEYEVKNSKELDKMLDRDCDTSYGGMDVVEVIELHPGDTYTNDRNDGLHYEPASKEELNEIGPLAAGLIGAAGGAVVGNLIASKKDENLEEDESKDNEPCEYFVMWDVYERYGGGNNIKQNTFKAKTLKDAVKKLASKLMLYLEPEEVDEEYDGNAREAISSIEESNGDGCDYIMTFKNNTTGEVYIKGDWSPEDDEDNWDDDYNESEKINESAGTEKIKVKEIKESATEDLDSIASMLYNITTDMDVEDDVDMEEEPNYIQDNYKEFIDRKIEEYYSELDDAAKEELRKKVYRMLQNNGYIHNTNIVNEAKDELLDEPIVTDGTEPEDELNEIGPLAAGLLGAAGGAIVGGLATKALKKNEAEDLKELEDSENTTSIYIDLRELIAYAEKYISKELRMAGGSDVKISKMQDGQYMITLNKLDNSVKAYCNLGFETASDDLEESDNGSFNTALIDDRYLIYSDGVVYDTEKAEDIPSYVFQIRDKITSGSDERRKFATDNQDELEKEYTASHTNDDGSVDWSEWEQFTKDKMNKEA